MRDELDRSMRRLSMEDMEKPYFLAYRVDEVEGFRVSARFGALDASSPSKRRSLSVELRVGGPDFDNTNFLGNYRGTGGSTTLPLDDDYDGLRRQLWLATDSAYKNAQRKLAGKRAALQNRNRDAIPDFAAAESVQIIDVADIFTGGRLGDDPRLADVAAPAVPTLDLPEAVAEQIRAVRGSDALISRRESALAD